MKKKNLLEVKKFALIFVAIDTLNSAVKFIHLLQKYMYYVFHNDGLNALVSQISQNTVNPVLDKNIFTTKFKVWFMYLHH